MQSTSGQLVFQGMPGSSPVPNRQVWWTDFPRDPGPLMGKYISWGAIFFGALLALISLADLGARWIILILGVVLIWGGTRVPPWDVDAIRRVGVSDTGVTIIMASRVDRVAWAGWREPTLKMGLPAPTAFFRYADVQGRRHQSGQIGPVMQMIFSHPNCPQISLSDALREYIARQSRLTATWHQYWGPPA